MLKQNFALILILNFILSCSAPGPVFKKIEYARFAIFPQKSNRKDSLSIGLYSVINKAGILTVLNDDNYHNTLTFYTYKLSSDQLNKINLIFDNKKTLKEYLIKKDLGVDTFYSGNYDFYKVTYDNGKTDSLCFVEPFMSEKFNLIYNMLYDIYFSEKENKIKHESFSIPADFKNAILESYKNSTYLPENKSLEGLLLR